ncbi:(2Fe-2S) ferredoxin domain-containing protein [Streptomonospora litoralis]|uniref:(2Fe-2S) ferredoxin domain-containing protein n=1 Tax=Streptomonospora litoralis TaxID=2498135 RepID=A0A4P6Q3T7_9ACTN|nr:(2Fe-2S) ferredoxin domain-containing protein [Streptomonospora litoralis]QBI55358.1 hypothetical protein EKD16_17970 [Streptomonospora litoralis]
MIPTGRPCRLVVCRGCCCGTAKKRPGVDHEGQLERLRGLRDAEGRNVPVRTSDCLGPCFQANVVVVQPSTEGRESGGRPVWLGSFTEDRLVDDLDSWIRAGGPGAVPLPDSLADRVTSKDAEKPKKAKKSKKTKKSKKDEKADNSGKATRGEDPAAGRAPGTGKSGKADEPKKAAKAEKAEKKTRKSKNGKRSGKSERKAEKAAKKSGERDKKVEKKKKG